MRITPEIHKQVEDKVIKTVEKINSHYNIGMTVPAIYYDVHSTNGGLAKYSTMSIHFNPKLMEEDLEHYLKTTVPHEVCHIGVWKKYLHEKKKVSPKAHGNEWKLMMWVVGSPPRRTHEYDVEDVKRKTAQYEYKCGCKYSVLVGARIHNNIKDKTKTYSCKKCGVMLKDGIRILQLGFSRSSPNNTTKVRDDLS